MTQTNSSSNPTPLVCFIVISITVVGYFVGLQSPLQTAPERDYLQTTAEPTVSDGPSDRQAVLAAAYSEMGEITQAKASAWKTKLEAMPPAPMSLEPFEITPEEKQLALQRRTMNRAFNGAPPTVPHPVDQFSNAACMLCHGEGFKTASMRGSKMSHPYYTNCTQCHVPAALPEVPATSSFQNSFVGLPAPEAGEIAFTGAPPTVPHSSWMRSDCSSCHGTAGLQGIRSTHPWRLNCTQCHAGSATLNQVLVSKTPEFLPGPKIVP